MHFQDPESFLYVGNPACLGENGLIAASMGGMIVVLSTFFELLVHKMKHSADGPQLSAVLDRAIQEVMILGFIR